MSLAQPTPDPNADEQPRQILFVDDDQEFLESVGQLFDAWSQGSWRLHLANSTARALSILDASHLDLVVIDIHMPVVDGSQFLQMLHRRFPDLTKVVMTGYGNDDLKNDVLNNGADLFLEKPRSSEGFETVFATLNELAATKAQDGFQGLLRKVGLSDVLQMECLARNSSILHLVAKEEEGRIFIDGGNIIHAEVGHLRGEAAFNHLFSFKGGNFSLRPYEAPPQKSIEANWEFLVMEAARKRDEAQVEEEQRLAAQEGAEPGEAPAAPQTYQPRKIQEVVVCTGKNEVLYSWECRDLDARIKLIKMIQQKADILSQNLTLGILDRVEMEGPDGRAIAQFDADRKVWVRSKPDGERKPLK